MMKMKQQATATTTKQKKERAAEEARKLIRVEREKEKVWNDQNSESKERIRRKSS